MEIKIKQINQNCAQEINKIKQFEPLVYILILNWNGWQDTLERDGPHSLDSNWTSISVFLHYEHCALERSNEKKTTQSFI